MAVFVGDHPLIKHKLGLMRKKDISTKDFRELSSEVARLLTYEATKHLDTEKKTVEGWAGPVEIEGIKGKKNHHCTNFAGRPGHDGRGTGSDSVGQGECGGVLPG